MKRCVGIVVGLLLGATSALAASQWRGPGWYQVEDGDFTRITAGPFETQDACEATLPADREDALYDCSYLRTAPDWDR